MKKLTYSCLVILILNNFAYATVYVYEVATKDRRFLTSSKKAPATYLFSYGGKDTILNLKVVKVYDDNNIEKAIKDFDLGKYNKKELLPKDYPINNYFSPFIWWR